MMKKVVALKNYTDPYYIFREGMIYNLENSVANKFVASGVMTEGTPDDVVITSASTSGTQIADIKINGQSNKIYAPADENTSGVLTINLIEDGSSYTMNKTWQEIKDAMANGNICIISGGDDLYHQISFIYFVASTGIKYQVYTFDINENGEIVTSVFEASASNEYPCIIKES